MIFAWAYIAFGVITWPLVAMLALVHPRTRKHLRERLGFPILEVEPGAVWLHAASLGETKIVAAISGPIRAALPKIQLVRSCTSDTARVAEAPVDQALCAPLDALPFVLPWLDRVRPRALVLVECELWPALLLGCRLRGIPITLLSPRVGKGVRRLRTFPGLEVYLLRGVDVLAPDGDLKQLANRVASLVTWPGEALVAGCTHEGEEEAVLLAWSQLPRRPLLILAPRDPARFSNVAALLGERSRTMGFHFVRRSMGSSQLEHDVDVLLLDSIGELAGLYEKARAAYIGGTLCAGVGGHSPAEAVAARCPVVRGPDISGNVDSWRDVPAFVAATPDDLPGALAAALRSERPPAPRAPGVEAVVALVSRLAERSIPEERPLRPWFWPLAPAWALAAALRPAPLVPTALPVISVGSLTAGGAGKTPVAAWIAARVPGSVVVSRGYGRSGGDAVRTEGQAGELGDELLMLQRRGLSVVSAPNRREGVAVAAKRGDKLAILDDALQYRAVARDLEIIVMDARFPDGGGPIPVGTRRVPRSWLKKADVLWTNHGSAPAWATNEIRPETVIVEAEYRPSHWLRRGLAVPLGGLPARPAVVLAGIARAEGFLRQLRELGVIIHRAIVFEDHHAFSWTDLQSIEAWQDDFLVITTEKDAARLPADAGVYALVVEVVVTRGESAFLERLSRVGARG